MNAPRSVGRWLDQSFTMKLAVVALLGGVAMFIFGAIVAASEAEPWNPLGAYPAQEITEVNGVFVHSSGVKCNDSEKDVDVRGTFGWQRVTPPGFAFTVGSGTGTRIPGCERFEFDNDIPDEVRAADTPGAVWRITGTEIPFTSEEEGLVRVWTTENFTLTPIEGTP